MLKSLIALMVVAVSPACSQTTPPKPAFEVASVKAAIGTDSAKRPAIRSSPNSVALQNTTLKLALEWAYHVMESQVQGPSWISSERYDIVAKSAVAVPEEQLRAMLQDLLNARFQITLHRQTKEFAAYVLTVGKNGPKIQESKSEGEMDIQPQKERMSIAAQRVTVSTLTDTLSRMLQAPVIDQTGLKGKYDVTLNVAKYLADMQPAGGGPPDIVGVLITALQEEFGLRMESKKIPLEVLIVDRADKIPGDN